AVSTGASAAALPGRPDLASAGCRDMDGHWLYAPLLLTPAGFALSVLFTTRVFQNAQGSGVPQVIAARESEDLKVRSSLVAPKVAIGKVLLTALGLACGASIGREGPTVQVGASVMYA